MRIQLARYLAPILLTCLSIAPLGATSPGKSLFATSSPVLENRPVSQIDISVQNLPAGQVFHPEQITQKLKTTVGAPFSQAAFDSDLKALSQEFDRVEPKVELQQGRVVISLVLWQKPTIESISWTGNQGVSTKKLNKELGIRSGAVFNRQDFNKAFNKVREYYIKKGYFESQLQYHVTSDSKTGLVKIAIQVDEGRSGKIAKIEFHNFTSSEESAIVEKIYTKQHNLFISWVTGTGIYNEEAVEQDQLIITNILQNEGYADAHVTITPEATPYEGWINLQIVLDRGPIYHLGSVTFSGNHIFSQEDIENYLLVHSGDPYSPEKVRDTQQALKDLYGRRGHIEATVQYDVQIVEDQPIYNLHFTIDEGGEYKVGLVHIFGNAQTNPNVILRESLLVPGETFDSAKLKYTEMRLMNMGYFKSVNVYAVRSKDDLSLGDNYRDIYIDVQETTTGNVGLFFGISTQDSISGGLDIAETNFNYKGFSKLFSEGPGALRGGGEYTHLRANIGAKQQSYTASWLDPYFLDSLWRVGLDGNYTSNTLISNDYHLKTVTVTLNAGYPFARFWTFNTKYRVRDTFVSLSQKLTKPVVEETPAGPEIVPNPAGKEVDSEGVISLIGCSLNYDSSDHPVKPHNGFRSLLEADFAGLGGDFVFTRFNFVNTFYLQLWRKGILKYRADFHFVWPMGKTPKPVDIPISERFFMGGETTVRGYKPFSLGTKDTGTSDPTGGNTASLLSVEYLQEILPFLDGFVFADAGMVNLEPWRFNTYRASAGFGARVQVMGRMPIILGLGFPINPGKKDETRNFFFSMGGQF